MKNQVFRPHNPQSGSIFIWIFIMIALFAALSWAMSQTSRTGGATVSADQAKLAALEILEYQALVRDGLKAMRINGIPLREISFESSTTFTQAGAPFPYSNGNCTSNACKVFDASGGGVPAEQFDEYAGSPLPGWWGSGMIHAGTVVPTVARVLNIGTSAPELMLHVIYVNIEVCKAVNKLMGITTWPTNEAQAGKTFYTFAWTVDTALAATDTWSYGDTVPELKGKTAFCMSADANGGDIMLVVEAR